MAEMGRRERKKAQVRQHLADVAMGLFAERGFDAVSVSEIAEAADVARPTVFAHFARKEDLLFDRYPEARAVGAGATRGRPAGSAAVAALSELLVGLADQRHPLSTMRGAFRRFWEV